MIISPFKDEIYPFVLFFNNIVEKIHTLRKIAEYKVVPVSPMTIMSWVNL